MANNALRSMIMIATAAATASTATVPLLATIGSTVAETIEPGRASSMRRVRALGGTWPIIQKPAARTRNVMAAIARMASTSRPAGSSAIMEELRGDAAGDRAQHDEPPARNQLRRQQRDRAGD